MRNAMSGEKRATITRMMDRWDSFVELSSDIHYCYSVARHSFSFLSPSIESITGCSREECRADPGVLYRLVHPEDKAMLQRMLEGDPSAMHVFLRWRRRDGGTTRSEHHNVAVRRGPHVSHIVGTARDVTEHASRESHLIEQSQLFSAIVSGLDLGIWVGDADGYTVYANATLSAMVQYELDELIGRSGPEFLQALSPSGTVDLIEWAVTRRAEPLELRLIDRQGCPMWTVAWLHPLQALEESNHAPAGVVALIANPRQLYLSAGEVKLDMAKLSAEEGGREVKLTLRELHLLRYLIQHRGKPLARRQLLAHVWGITHQDGNRTVDVHMCHLRKKLPSLAGDIVAVGGSSYMLRQAGSPPMLKAGHFDKRSRPHSRTA